MAHARLWTPDSPPTHPGNSRPAELGTISDGISASQSPTFSARTENSSGHLVRWDLILFSSWWPHSSRGSTNSLSFSGRCLQWKERTCMLEQPKPVSWAITSSVYSREIISHLNSRIFSWSAKSFRLLGGQRSANVTLRGPPPLSCLAPDPYFYKDTPPAPGHSKGILHVLCGVYHMLAISVHAEIFWKLPSLHVWKMHWGCYLSRDCKHFLPFVSIHAPISTSISETHSAALSPAPTPFPLKTKLSTVYFLSIGKMSLHLVLSLYQEMV